MKPDRAIVRALRRIDPLLSVRWLKPKGLWAVFHDLPLNENIDQAVRTRGVEIQNELLKRGYVSTRRVCEEYALLQIHDQHLVFYVCEDDGSFRPLDMRVVEKMQRMDWFRRNWELKNWKEYMTAKTEVQRELRERSWNDHCEYVKRDPVYRAQVVDALRGDPHTRAINVTQPDKPARYPIAETQAERGQIIHASS